MFFRLPKNTIKNLHFGPFGGGYPPSPPPPLNTAPAYAFIGKIMIFCLLERKNIFVFSFGGGRERLRSNLPPSEDWGVAYMKCGRGET